MYLRFVDNGKSYREGAYLFAIGMDVAGGEARNYAKEISTTADPTIYRVVKIWK